MVTDPAALGAEPAAALCAPSTSLRQVLAVDKICPHSQGQLGVYVSLDYA
jgi:hypothetical protein